MAVKKTTRKRKVLKKIDRGQVHVHTTHNNTIVTVTDMNGNTVSWASSGVLGLKGARKETAFAATQVTERAINDAKQHGIRRVEIYIKGTGQGREPSIRAIQAADVDIAMIKDVSPIPHNGCRPPKRRRL
ncbi:MAG: 30S ribosomal protein S11 [Bacillota bacterium]